MDYLIALNKIELQSIRKKSVRFGVNYIIIAALTIAVIFGAESTLDTCNEGQRAIGFISGVIIQSVIVAYDFLHTVWSIAAYLLQSKPSYPHSTELVSAAPISPNFANIFGGATILSKSSGCIGMSSVLSDDKDRYMYAENVLPIEFVIGLKEQIAMESLTLRSTQMYSSIIKRFKVEGSFTFPDANWTELGSFKAKNSFEQQNFIVPRKIVRYVKITITSVYGGWLYVTLTQVKVFGESIFAHAVKSTAHVESPQEQKHVKQPIRSIMAKNPGTDSSCPSDPQTVLLHSNDTTQDHKQNNLIIRLHQKIQKLESYTKTLESMFDEMNTKYMRMANKMKKMQQHIIKDQVSSQDMIHNISSIDSEVKNLGMFKKVLYQISWAFILVIVTVVLIVHLYCYIKEGEPQPKQPSNIPLKSILRGRGESRTRTMKLSSVKFPRQ